MFKKGQNFQQKPQRNIEKEDRDQLCHKCGSPDQFIIFFPLWAVEHKTNMGYKLKEPKRDLVLPNHRRVMNQEADLAVKRAFAVLDGCSYDSKEEDHQNQSLMAMMDTNDEDIISLVTLTDSNNEEEESKSSDNILALMAGFESENKGDFEVCFLDLKPELKKFSKKKLESLASILIDAYYSSCSNKDQMLSDYASLRMDCKKLEEENTSLQNSFKKFSSKGKSKATILQESLEEDIRKPNVNIHELTEKNKALIDDLVRTKKDLENSNSWTRSLGMLS